jgi:hypothetical protein
MKSPLNPRRSIEKGLAQQPVAVGAVQVAAGSMHFASRGAERGECVLIPCPDLDKLISEDEDQTLGASPRVRWWGGGQFVAERGYFITPRTAVGTPP